MSDVDKGKKYMEQMTAEINTCFLLRDFKNKLLEFNQHLDMLVQHSEEIPSDSEFYRARCIGIDNYKDLVVVNDENGQEMLYGLAPEKMLAPPIGEASSGRANKHGESFLYLANTPEVCCAEVRPIFTEMISVIKFKIRKKIKVINLKACNTEDARPLEIEITRRSMLSMVEPVKEQTDDNYALTQYVTQYFKSKGFDGIKYGTSNSNDRNSFNIVLFDENNVCWEEDQKSEVYRVIFKSSKFQNLTSKMVVTEISNGFEKLEIKEVDEIISKISKHIHKLNTAN